MASVANHVPRVSCVIVLRGQRPALARDGKRRLADMTDVCGVIDADRTWAAGSVYVATSCTVTVNPNVTVTVSPGAVVKFSGSMMVVNGRLIAQGADGAPIVFTSDRDDAHGGYICGFHIGLLPGDWAKLVINGPGSVLDYAGSAMVAPGMASTRPILS